MDYFKIMSFNLRYSNEGDGANAWPYRVHRVEATILQADPLFICTQEGLQTMLEDLDERLPSYSRVGTGREGGNKGEHCAIYYKKDIVTVLDSGQFWLSEEPNVAGSKSWDSALPRICTWAHMRWLEDDIARECLVYNTHLDHIGQTARIKGAELIWESMRKHRLQLAIPAVLAGDFNAYPNSVVIRFLQGQIPKDGQSVDLINAYTVLPEIGRTAHEFKGGVDGQPPIDYIFVTPELEVLSTEVERRQVDGGYPSDHYPIITHIR